MPVEDMQGAEPATFALNASQSSVVELAPYKLVAIEVPPGFTGTTLTLLASYRAAGPFYPVYTDAGDEVTITVAASTVVGVDGPPRDTVVTEPGRKPRTIRAWRNVHWSTPGAAATKDRTEAKDCSAYGGRVAPR